MFHKYSEYYEVLNQDKNYLEECNLIDNLLTKHGHQIKNILEIGSGTGTHLKILETHFDYSCHGLEISSDMCGIAKKKNNIELTNTDLLNFQTAHKYDAVISMFHVISYITNTKELVTTFKKVSEILEPNGLFLFDVWYSPAVNNLKPSKRVKETTMNKLKITRTTNFKENTIRSLVNVFFDFKVHNYKNEIADSFTEEHPMRHFSYNEIELLGCLSGLNIEECISFPEMQLPNRESWGTAFIMKKRL